MTIVPEVLFFASGDETGGGSGFETAAIHQAGDLSFLPYKIVGAVSNHANGGVREKADRLRIPFHHWDIPSGEARDINIMFKRLGRTYPVMMSGWLKRMLKVDPRKVINIHRGPTWMRNGERPYAGQGMHGMAVHEAIHCDFMEGLLTHTEVTIHAATEEYGAGGVIARIMVELLQGDTPETIAKRVNVEEHRWQKIVMSAWLHGQVQIDASGQVLESPFPR